MPTHFTTFDIPEELDLAQAEQNVEDFLNMQPIFAQAPLRYTHVPEGECLLRVNPDSANDIAENGAKLTDHITSEVFAYGPVNVLYLVDGINTRLLAVFGVPFA